MQKNSILKWFKYWYKIRFKVRIARATIKWRRFKKKAYSPKKPEIDSTQKKAIELFLALLKNKDTNLIHSPESSTRIIESDFVWATMASHSNEYLFNIIDETNGTDAHSHEVYIPKEYGFEIVDEFDFELERRFRVKESSKKKVIVDELDKLINKINTPNS